MTRLARAGKGGGLGESGSALGVGRSAFGGAARASSASIPRSARWAKPALLVREMGLGPSLVFQVLVGGLILSSLAHPLILGYIGVIVWRLAVLEATTVGPLDLTLFALDFANIAGSYAVFIALGRIGMTQAERLAVGPRWLLTPLYWLLISQAAWRAVRELHSNPFFWNKTAHRPAQTKVQPEAMPAAAE